MLNPDEVTDFWLNDVGPKGWYMVDGALDAKIRDRFLVAWQEALDGGYADWKLKAEPMLAYLILLDQFPRNMFRGDGRSFASDKMARGVAKKAIDHEWDLRVEEPARQFFYLPLMHSECLTDQDRCVRLMKTRMPLGGESSLLHAKAHRHVIRQFGRFPYRNEALERKTTDQEAEFLKNGGYMAAVKEIQDSLAA